MSRFFNMIGSACASTLRLSRAKLAIAAASGLTLAGTSVSQAHYHDRGFLDVVVAPEVRCERPVPVCTEQERIWVPAAYRTVCDRVWHEGVSRTVCDRVLVPAVVEVREVHHRDRYRDFCTRESVIVSPAHYEERQRVEVITAGYFEDVKREELVCAGHWEVRDRVVLERVHPAIEILPRVDLRIGR